jgi:hypothetical protein
VWCYIEKESVKKKRAEMESRQIGSPKKRVTTEPIWFFRLQPVQALRQEPVLLQPVLVQVLALPLPEQAQAQVPLQVRVDSNSFSLHNR